MNKTLGVILCILGPIGLTWGGFSYHTRSKLVDIGPIHATRSESHYVPLPPIIGGLAFAGGVLLLVLSGRKTGA